MSDNFNSLIAHVTGGRRYCFVLMSYHEGFTFFEKLRKIVAEVTGFECIRADDLPGAGADLRIKIHKAIDNAVFVIGDVSEPRPNIYYELGYATACLKPVLLIARENSEIHTDLQGLEMIPYTDNRDGWQRFEISLRQHLDIHKDSNVSLLRAMILPSDPVPSFIVINPKQPQADSRFRHHPKERKTYGDYLGLSGIIGAFASVYGEHVIPEIVSAANADESIIKWDANLFLIGSPKVNLFTEILLSKIQEGKDPDWRFEKCSDEENYKDFEIKLTGKRYSGFFQTECSGPDKTDRSANFTDYGLIVRGRHPYFPGRSVLILAGPHSTGTGSACLAATKPQLLQAISQKLTGIAELADRSKAIWVLVKGTTDESGHLDVSGVGIEEAGVF
jgi:hypothetical protein